MRLIDVVAQLHVLNDAETIYAKEPWSECCDAVVAPEDEGGALVPPQLQPIGFRYFLEVAIAKEVLHDWIESEPGAMGDGEACARLIHYAIHDA
jgi:hypothetical protein